MQATTHAEQQVDLQAQRLVVLHNQLEQANGGLIKLELTVKHAHQQQSSFNLQRDDLQRKLTVCQGEVRELESRLSAACMESAGRADAPKQRSAVILPDVCVQNLIFHHRLSEKSLVGTLPQTCACTMTKCVVKLWVML